MRKTQKIIASLAAVGALAVGSFAVAAPLPEGALKTEGPVAGVQAPIPQAAPNSPRMERRLARFEAMARTLTFKDDAQQSAWKHYVDARLALDSLRGAHHAQPPIDEQDRLERDARAAALRADALKKVAESRASLLKVLSPEQKYVLEQMEKKPRPGPKAGPDRRPPMPCHPALPPGHPPVH